MRPGTIVGGDFRVVEPLGKGGMGEVFVAEQLSTSKRRALKIMKPELVGDPTLRARFEQEARVGARIQSEHVVEVVAAGIDASSGAPFLAMELLEGEPLDRALQRNGPMPHADAREIFAQLGHGLAAAHRAGVVHRDLKPENVFIAASRQQGQRFKVKILDFGISKLTAEAAHRTQMTSSLGTPRWMAPEQSGGQPITAATDVWALGLIVYWALTGRYYWRHAVGGPSDSVMTLMREVLFEPLVPASSRAQEQGVAHRLPPGFDAWFARAVAREPRERFADGGAAVAALDALFGNAASAHGPAHPSHGGSLPTGNVVWTSQPSDPFGQTVARSVRRPPSASRPWVGVVIAVVAVLGLAGLGGGAFLVKQARDRAAEEERAERRERKEREERRRRDDEDEDEAADEEDAEVAPPDVPPPSVMADLAGTWLVALGRNPNGTSYTGRASFRALGAAHQIDWSMGQSGVALAHLGVVGVAYGATPGFSGKVLVCFVSGGSLSCRSADTADGGRLSDLRFQGPGGLSGTYPIVEPRDRRAGWLKLEPRGQALACSLSLDGRTSERGMGIARGNTLTVAISANPDATGAVVYDYGPSRLVGSWVPPNGSFLGQETLERR